MTFIAKFAALIARILIAPLFILSGLGKALNVTGTEQYLQSVGWPASLALPTAVFELVAGVFILLGLFQRVTAVALALFCVLTALIFHNDFADTVQQAAFLKNIALAGGLMMLFAYGNMSASVDGWRDRYRRVRDNPVVVKNTTLPDGRSVRKLH